MDLLELRELNHRRVVIAREMVISGKPDVEILADLMDLVVGNRHQGLAADQLLGDKRTGLAARARRDF